MKPKSLINIATRSLLAGFIFLNIIAYTAAYFFTHYQSGLIKIGIARPQNYNTPQDFGLPYKIHKIFVGENQWLHSWLILSQHSQPKGVVLLFHGKDNNKSSLVPAAEIFYNLGYHTLLVDFRGVGQSSGYKTTIGHEEGKDVVNAVKYIKNLPEITPELPLILHGISLGSAAILEAIAQHQIKPDAVILELPFTSLLDAVKVRLRTPYLPASPMAELIVFWGSIQHGFNGFRHQPQEDAKKIDCPTLILAGDRDSTVSLEQINTISQNIEKDAQITIFPEVGHQILALANQELWQETVTEFLRVQKFQNPQIQ